MTRFLRYIFLAIIAILLIVFASANRDVVNIRALPDDVALLFMIDWQFQVPVFLVLFAGIVIGLFVGFTWEWLREHKIRRTANTKTRQVSKLERELATLKDQTSLPDDDVLALLEKPKAR